jgi:hypothetical protein
MDDEQVQYWEMRVEGRLLDDVSRTRRIVRDTDKIHC